MTTITQFGPDRFFNENTSLLLIDSVVTNTSTRVVYNNGLGEIVVVTGTGLVFDGQSGGSTGFSAGTVSQITISTDGGLSSDVNVRFADINKSAVSIFGNAQGFAFDADAAMNALFEGDVTYTSFDGVSRVFMDGVEISGGGTVMGGDKTGSYLGEAPQSISGGAKFVDGGTTYIGGVFQFTGNGSIVNGDGENVQNGSTVYGGDDRLIYEAPDGVEELFQSLTWTGDVIRPSGNSTIYGGDDLIDLRDAQTGGEGVTVIGDAATTAEGDDSIIYGGNDTIYGSRTDDNRLFGDGFLNLNSLTDVPPANPDLIFGGDDTIFGGDGNDTIHGDQEDSRLFQSFGGDDTIYGGAGDDLIYGNAGNDRLFDGAGQGSVFGGNGNDHFSPTGAGTHTFFGGNGVDRIDFSDSTAGVTINVQTGALSGGFASGVTLDSVEEFYGSDLNDTLTGVIGAATRLGGNGGNDVIKGGRGDNVLFGGNGQDRIIVSTQGAEQLFGGGGADTLDLRNSAAGMTVNLGTKSATGILSDDSFFSFENLIGTTFADDLRGDSGDNALYGGNGADDLKGLTGADALSGGGGFDVLAGGKGNDDLSGNGSGDSLFGGTGNDSLFGGGGDDILRAGGGKDRLQGGKGDDDLRGASGADRLFGGSGGDALRGENGGDTLKGGGGRDLLSGAKGKDKLFGNSGADSLSGNSGADTLYGGKGADVLIAGKGKDKVFGGKGSDEFHFYKGFDQVTVKDFQNNRDTLVFDGLGKSPLNKAQQDGKDVVFDFGNGDELVIKGITLGALSNDIEFL